MNQIHLNLFLRTEGFHHAAWRHESAAPERANDVTRAVEMVEIAERGLFDAVFLSDSPSIGRNPWQYFMHTFENMTLLSALAMVTEHIGLIASSSTTYNEPYNVARQFASLDHISGGRAGWNVVTSQALVASENFSSAPPLSHSARYGRAEEFFSIVVALWDSWEEDALVADKATGILVDPDKVHPIDHVGERFSVRGPLDVARSPQGHPLIVQAGSSEDGMAFGARIADAIYTCQNTLEEARLFYASFRALAKGYGRDPDTIKILPGLAPILGSTEQEARALAAELEGLVLPERTLVTISNTLQVDLTKYPYDGPVPLDDVPPNDEIEGSRSRNQLIVDLCRREGLTIRQLLRWFVGGGTHRVFVGTPEQLARDIELWTSTGASDGFNLMPSLNINGLPIFVDEVVPLLQKRGLFRDGYEATTLRGLFGLPRVERRIPSVVVR